MVLMLSMLLCHSSDWDVMALALKRVISLDLALGADRGCHSNVVMFLAVFPAWLNGGSRHFTTIQPNWSIGLTRVLKC